MSEKSAFLPMPTVFFFTEKFRSLSQLVQRPAAAVRANCNERPKAAIRPLSGAASQLPRPDIRAWCSEIVGSQSALRDQAVVRFTCSIGFMVCVRMAPKGGEPPDSDAAGHLQHQAEADVSLEMRRRRCMTDVERRRST